MKTNRKELVAALSAVSAGVSDKEVIEQTSSFAFLDGYVYSFNDEIAVSCPVSVDFEGAVPAKQLTALLSKLKAEEVELIEKNGELRVKGSKAKAGLRLDDDILLPIDEVDIPEKWKKLPKDFCSGLKDCLSSVSKDAAKPILMCIHVCGDVIESSDDLRITRYTTDGKAFKTSVLIPAASAKLLIANKPTGYGKSNGWVHFRNKKDTIFSCRCLEEPFPNTSAVITGKGAKIKFPDVLPEILGRAAAINDGERVVVSLEKNAVTVSSSGAAGWFKEKDEAKYKGEDVSFEIEPEYLTQLIKMEADVILTGPTLEFSTENSVHVVRVLPPSK